MGEHDEDSRERTPSELEGIHSTLREILSTLKSLTNFAGFFWVMVAVLLFEGWPGSKLDRWTDKVWQSFRYDADFKNITVEKRPLGCDFFHAPLGSKGCKYKKRTIVFADKQRRTLIKEATTVEEQQAYAKQPNSVAVYWQKNEEE